jgi:hypothetical protein
MLAAIASAAIMLDGAHCWRHAARDWAPPSIAFRTNAVAKVAICSVSILAIRAIPPSLPR